MAKERNLTVDVDGFNEAFKQHQELARSTNAGVFKGGLADTSEWTTRLHTACHILLAGLRKKFGDHIEQKGSNITSERLRFDFNFDRKLTDEEVVEIEKFVNDAIAKGIEIERKEMSFKDAKAQGGYGVHKADENEIVSVYSCHLIYTQPSERRYILLRIMQYHSYNSKNTPAGKSNPAENHPKS